MSPAQPRRDLTFYCKNGVIGIGRLDDPKGVQWAVCAMTLIRGGKYVFPLAEEKIKSDVANGIRARTAAGLKPDGTAVILLVDEGGSDKGMSQREVADYLLSRGCSEAVVLDGGGSSTGFTNDADLIKALDIKVGSHVCETGAAPRAVAHVLAFFLDKAALFPKPADLWKGKSASDIKLIDVSHHQGTIDWAKVAADGVKGAIIKATEGVTGIDKQLSVNAVGAAKAGLLMGFYHYARPENNDAKKEAAHFAATVKGYRSDFPLVLDVEGDASKIGTTTLTKWCVTFLQELERITDCPAMIYTGASFAKAHLGKELGSWPLWIAHYGVDKPMANNTWSEWSVFQYSDSGKVNGIAGNVDMNAMEKLFFDKYSKQVKEESALAGKFKDVPAGHYAEKSIEKAAEAKVINGVADGVFGLGQPVTREQLAVILDRLKLLEK